MDECAQYIQNKDAGAHDTMTSRLLNPRTRRGDSTASEIVEDTKCERHPKEKCVHVIPQQGLMQDGYETVMRDGTSERVRHAC